MFISLAGAVAKEIITTRIPVSFSSFSFFKESPWAFPK
jgi:hypothetical protein